MAVVDVVFGQLSLVFHSLPLSKLIVVAASRLCTPDFAFEFLLDLHSKVCYTEKDSIGGSGCKVRLLTDFHKIAGILFSAIRTLPFQNM